MAAHWGTASRLGNDMAHVGHGSEFMISRSAMLALRSVVTILLLMVAVADGGCGGEVINGERWKSQISNLSIVSQLDITSNVVRYPCPCVWFPWMMTRAIRVTVLSPSNSFLLLCSPGSTFLHLLFCLMLIFRFALYRIKRLRHTAFDSSEWWLRSADDIS